MSKKQGQRAVGRPTLKSGMKAQRLSISILPHLIAHAEARATATGESLSGFIGSLIEADMTGATSPPLEQRVERLEAVVFPKAKPPQ